MTYAVMRQLWGNDSILSQRATILSYAKERGLTLDDEMIEFENSKLPLEERRRFRDFIHSLSSSDIVVVERIEVLAYDMEEAIMVINCMLSRDISLHIASNRIEVTAETGLSKILPILVQLKSDEEKGRRDPRVGRPKGRKSSSKFDTYLSEIMEGLKAGKSVSALARELGVSRSSLKDYIESRQLKKIVDDSWLQEAKNRLEKIEIPKVELSCTLNNK